MSDYTKYTTALAMMDELVATSKSIDISKLTTKELYNHPVINAGWDELYEYIYTVFKAPDSNNARFSANTVPTEGTLKELASMKEMFKLNREEIEEQVYKIPPVVLEQCFPVWIARYLLDHMAIPVNPSNLTIYSTFRNLYGYMVINAS